MNQKIRVGTYNTNNLFDRFDDPYNYSDDPWRNYFASKPKKLEEIYDLGARIRASDVDIMALQEIESLGARYNDDDPIIGLNGKRTNLVTATELFRRPVPLLR